MWEMKVYKLFGTGLGTWEAAKMPFIQMMYPFTSRLSGRCVHATCVTARQCWERGRGWNFKKSQLCPQVLGPGKTKAGDRVCRLLQDFWDGGIKHDPVWTLPTMVCFHCLFSNFLITYFINITFYFN